MPKINYCLFCSDPIKKGRSDKKFCDSTCKDGYYNERKVDENKEIRKITIFLKRNRRILKGLYDPKKIDRLFSREDLIKKGFEFGFHTHVVITRTKSNEFIFCYNYGYREVKENSFQIIEGFDKVYIKGGSVFRSE